MEKHLMVCIRADDASSYAIRFIKDFFNSPCDVRITLVNIVPPKGSWDKNNALKTGKRLLEEKRNWFIDNSFCDESKIDFKTIQSRGNTAREIVQEGHKGMYDAIVLGRQTSSMLEEFFDYSVGSRVIWEEINFPLWFCKCPHDIPKKDILLCVDEDEPSERIADHVGFILNDNINHKITMLHVRDAKSRKSVNIEDVFALTREHLIGNGVNQERIKELVIESNNVTKAILTEAAKGDYAAVAAGRGVHDRTAAEKLFPKSVCVKLLQGLNGTALWISR